MQRLAKMVLPAAALAICAASTGCSAPSAPDPVLPTPATSPATPSASPTAASTPDAVSAAPTIMLFSSAACAPAVLLPLMKRMFDQPAAGLVIERVTVKRCRNGYVHLFAISRHNPTGSSNFENEQLFMHFVGGQWQSISEGTGISCSDTDLRPRAMLTACRALGYRS